MKKQVGRVGGPRGERRDRRGGEGKRERESERASEGEYLRG